GQALAGRKTPPPGPPGGGVFVLGRGSSSGKDAGGTSRKRQFEPGSPRHSVGPSCWKQPGPVSFTPGLGPEAIDQRRYTPFRSHSPLGDPFPQRVGLGPP